MVGVRLVMFVVGGDVWLYGWWWLVLWYRIGVCFSGWFRIIELDSVGVRVLDGWMESRGSDRVVGLGVLLVR